MRRILCLVLCLTFLIFPVQAAQKNEKYVALTFDDGPSGRFTRRLLDGLAERDAKATFFLCGYRIAQYLRCVNKKFHWSFLLKKLHTFYNLI